jgi:hypothetical protein
VFSPQDYELAARLLGLPVPKTPAECAAATPMTATVLRSYYKAPAPMPGFEGEGVNTSATRSLNAMPRVSQPEARDQLAHRLQAGLVTRDDDIEVRRILELLISDPEVREMFMDFIASIQQNSNDSGEFYGQQRPVEFDVPGLGGQYSMLNAPGSSSIPPSQHYQALS